MLNSVDLGDSWFEFWGCLRDSYVLAALFRVWRIGLWCWVLVCFGCYLLLDCFV